MLRGYLIKVFLSVLCLLCVKALTHICVCVCVDAAADDVLFWESIPLGATGKMSKKDIRDILKRNKYQLPSLVQAQSKL